MNYIIFSQILIFISVALIVFSRIVRKKSIEEYNKRLLNSTIEENKKTEPKRRMLDNIHKKIGKAGYKFSPEVFVILEFISVIACYLLANRLLNNVILSIPVSAAGLLIPHMWLKYKTDKRKQLILDQLIEWLDYMSSMGKAGRVLLSAFEDSINNTAEPLKSELETILSNVKKSTSIADAFDEAARNRIPLKKFETINLAISVHTEISDKGWPNTFESIANDMRDDKNILDKIDSGNTESKITSLIVGLTPAVMFIIFKIFQPDYVDTSLQSPIGVIAYILAFAWALAGMYFVRKLSDVSKHFDGGT